MKIAIIGAGKVGMALAGNWASFGHQIFLGVRDPKSKSNLAGENITVHLPSGASKMAEIVLIALPVPAIVETIKTFGSLDGKVAIDATNSVFEKPTPYLTGYHALKDLTKAEVAKGFNTTGYENMADPTYNGKGIDMFTAGESTIAKKAVKQLAMDAGFGQCFDFGGGDKVELIEQFAISWINLAIMQNEGRDIAFTVVKR